ncbi:ribonuclease E [Roseinatronobacter thiooxidans]|uniref:Ribonuclease E n=1 Tax=Roseinatronobacter thiooxidans TaxID=121821 RepID=A0A2W7Q0T3_9RHOB|nr:ribonuclease E/G [Roseinatronobacter thiooxidans]PZX37767.1 ribonuclease E [Roseinatronobacter thiooxidans]
MAQKMLIDATHAEETRVVVVDGTKVEEFDFETASRRQLAGNIYLAKVTRVEPSLQAAFVDYGGNRHGFLAFNEIHPDYYQIPAADRAALLEEERALAADADEDEGTDAAPKARKGVQRSSNRRRQDAKPERSKSPDQVEKREISGMDIVETDGDDDALVTDTPEAPVADAAVAEVVVPDDSATLAAEDVKSAEGDQDEPYRAADHATEIDDRIEAVSDGDASEEVRPRRKPRMRRYKIQEVIKVRQIMLVQVVKEERGNKGAALTTYLSLAGRYCVLMPNTARGGGISRKITNAADRQKLKAIANEILVPEGAGLIIRTAGANRTKAEIKRDYEYLLRLWEQIRDLTLKSIAPTPIYEEGDLIKRTIRDLYSKNIDEVLVEGEAGYRVAKDFMKMIMPSHAKNVKLYQEQMPLFARYQVESYLAAMFNPTVQLPSGGYIVIGITEALVAIDINSGRATREGSIEETALKTNMEAAAEIARQLRLRDLAGLIVIDFIDMEERKNNASVEKMLKDKLKHDRARIQVGRISGFGLLEMSRQRLRPGMLEATTQPCPHCHGTGLIRSDDSMGLTVLRQIEEEGTRGRSREVLVRAPAAVVNFIINFKREHLAQIEARYGMAVRLEADPHMVSPDFEIEKFKTATRVPTPPADVVSISTTLMPDLEEEEDLVEEQVEETQAEEVAEADTQPRKKRRRRRRRRGGGQNGADDNDGAQETESDAQQEGDDAPAESEDTPPAVEADTPAEVPAPEAAEETPPAKPKRATRSRSKKTAAKTEELRTDTAEQPAQAVDAGASEGAEAQAEAAPAKPKRTRRKPAAKKKPVAEGESAEQTADAAPVAPESASVDRSDTPVAVAAPEPAIVAEQTPDAPQTEAAPVAQDAVVGDAVAPVQEEAPVPAPDTSAPVAEAPVSEVAAPPAKPEKKRSGWWSAR